jgi:hypothetical protein
MLTDKRDIVERLRDPMIESYGNRLEAADEIERLRDAIRAERTAIHELIE